MTDRGEKKSWLTAVKDLLTSQLTGVLHLNLGLLTQTADGGTHSYCGSSVEDVCAASLGLLAGLAVPDAHSAALDSVLAAEAAEVLGVLADLDLLDLLSQRGTVAGAVLADNPHFLCALRHRNKLCTRAGTYVSSPSCIMQPLTGLEQTGRPPKESGKVTI